MILVTSLWLLGIFLLIVSVVIGWFLAEKLHSLGVYGIENAFELLKIGRVEEWNALRDLNPNWKPVLKEINLSNAKLSGVNLRKADLTEADFYMADLSDADLTDSILVKANLSMANLKKSILDNSDLTDTKLNGAEIEGASTEGADYKKEQFTKGKGKIHHVNEYTNLSTKDILHLIYQDSKILDEISPIQFEESVAAVFRLLGYEVELKSRARFGFLDIIVRWKQPIGEFIFLVECKRYSEKNLVGIAPVQALYGILEMEKATGAFLVTTSRFTKEALEFAASVKNIQLVDRIQFIEWVKKAIGKSS